MPVSDRMLNVVSFKDANTEISVAGWTLQSFSGYEELSRLYRFQLQMTCPDPIVGITIPDGTPVACIYGSDILNKVIRFSIVTDVYDPVACVTVSRTRFFEGVISRFAFTGPTVAGQRPCTAEVVPLLWKLTQRTDCRIFENRTVTEIVAEVLADHGLYQRSDEVPDPQDSTGSMTVWLEFDDRTTAADHPAREYCVQYRESDFDFISRLMEEEGIFYYFEHHSYNDLMNAGGQNDPDQTGTYHRLVLADRNTNYSEANYEGAASPQLLFSLTALVGGNADRRVLTVEQQFQSRPDRVVLKDFDYLMPNDVTGTVGIAGASDNQRETFDYPGRFNRDRLTNDSLVQTHGSNLADWTLDAATTPGAVTFGTSLFTNLSPGYQFQLSDYPNSGSDLALVVTSVEHRAIEAAASDVPHQHEYTNTFTCIDSATTFRPDRITPRPIMQGPQTAIVVDTSGNPFPVDGNGDEKTTTNANSGRKFQKAAVLDSSTEDLGRVKVKFHWARPDGAANPGIGTRGSQLTCWVRVADNWGGRGYGFVFHPRIGQEVLLDFLEGDPDRPVITGRMFNSDQSPPVGIGLSKDTSGAFGVDFGKDSPVWWGKGDYNWVRKEDDAKVSPSQSVIRTESLDGGVTVHRFSFDPHNDERGIITSIDEAELPGIFKVLGAPIASPYDYISTLGGPLDGGWFDLYMGIFFGTARPFVSLFRDYKKAKGGGKNDKFAATFNTFMALFNTVPGLSLSNLFALRNWLPRERWDIDHYNEIRFEDKKGSEFIYMHAERDFSLDVERDYQLRAARNRNVLIDRTDKLVVLGERSETLKGGQTQDIFFHQNIGVFGNRGINVKRIGGELPTDASAVAKFVATPIEAAFAALQFMPVLLPSPTGIMKKTFGELFGNQEIEIQNDNNFSVGRDDVYDVGRDRVTAIGTAGMTKSDLGKLDELPEVPGDWTPYAKGMNEYLLKALDPTKRGVMFYGFDDLFGPGSNRVGNDRHIVSANRITHIQGNDLLEIGDAKLAAAAAELLPHRIGTKIGNRRILVHNSEEHEVHGSYKLKVTPEELLVADAFSPDKGGTYEIEVAHKYDLVVKNDLNPQFTGARGKLTITPDEIVLKASKAPTASSITLKADGTVTIKGKTIEIIGDPDPLSKIDIKAKDVGVEATLGTLSLKASKAPPGKIDIFAFEVKSDSTKSQNVALQAELKAALGKITGNMIQIGP